MVARSCYDAITRESKFVVSVYEWFKFFVVSPDDVGDGIRCRCCVGKVDTGEYVHGGLDNTLKSVRGS